MRSHCGGLELQKVHETDLVAILDELEPHSLVRELRPPANGHKGAMAIPWQGVLERDRCPPQISICSVVDPDRIRPRGSHRSLLGVAANAETDLVAQRYIVHNVLLVADLTAFELPIAIRPPRLSGFHYVLRASGLHCQHIRALLSLSSYCRLKLCKQRLDRDGIRVADVGPTRLEIRASLEPLQLIPVHLTMCVPIDRTVQQSSERGSDSDTIAWIQLPA